MVSPIWFYLFSYCKGPVLSLPKEEEGVRG
jgi:hypothetical protein